MSCCVGGRELETWRARGDWRELAERLSVPCSRTLADSREGHLHGKPTLMGDGSRFLLESHLT